jgi:PTH2 family peptidyl-tRNA hydrolase
MKTKQVIIMRSDLKVRRGKEDAQAAHAALAFLGRQIQQATRDKDGNVTVHVSDAAWAWIHQSYRKITLAVDSEQELLEIEAKAKAAGLECHLIVDSGLTEFHGVPTRTCLGIGPDYDEKIDAVTGHLRLY